MSRTHVRRRRLTVLALGAVAVWTISGPVANAVGLSGSEPSSPRSVVVRPGDTLWSIATDVRPGADPRPLVDAIASANDVDPGSLVPGQKLLIPPTG